MLCDTSSFLWASLTQIYESSSNSIHHDLWLEPFKYVCSTKNNVTYYICVDENYWITKQLKNKEEKHSGREKVSKWKLLYLNYFSKNKK